MVNDLRTSIHDERILSRFKAIVDAKERNLPGDYWQKINMKLKRLFSILALAIFGASSVRIGASLLNKAPTETNAESEKTWMFRVQLNLADASPNKEGNAFGDNPVEKVQFHCWGDGGFTKTIEAQHIIFNNFDYYGANISLSDADVIKGAQWVLTQKGIGDKYSVDITAFGSTETPILDKNIDFMAIEWEFANAWDRDKWKFTNIVGDKSDKLYLKIEGETNPIDFVKEPQNNVLAVRNLNYSNDKKPISLDSYGTNCLPNNFYYLCRKTSNEIMDLGSANWLDLKEAGTYDFIIADATITIKKHSLTDTYIYYVTDSGEASKDYIYSWGGSMQFGAFPGTKISDITEAKEVTNGVLHFQGGSDKKLIYKIPLQAGYPTGDNMFMFNNGTSEFKSDERAIMATATYWWTGPANIDATKGLEFLLDAETIRNAAIDYSVCNISSADARRIVDVYNSLSESIRTTYVDSSSTFTWTSIEMKDNTLVSYKAIVERLALVSGVSVAGSSLINLGNHPNFDVTVPSILAVIVVVGAIATATLIILKKRKHN